MAHVDQAAPIQITMRDFLMVIFRRKGIILSMVAVTTVVVFSALMMTPVVYTSSAKILIWGAPRGGQLNNSMLVLDSEQILSSESELISSRPILENAQAMLDEQAARGEPKVRIDEGRLRPDPVQKSRILILSYTASTADEAQRVCEAVTTAYTEYHNSLFKTPDLANFFQNEIQNAEDRMVELLNRRLDIKTQNDITDVGAEVERLSTILVSYRTHLVDVEMRIAAARAELAAAEQAQKSGDAEVPLTLGLIRAESTPLVSLSEALSSRLVEREKLLSVYTERHPAVKSLDNEIAEIRRGIARETEQICTLKRAELSSSQAERDVLLGRIGQIEDRMRILPIAERDLDEIKSDIGTMEHHFANLYYLKAQAAAGSTSMSDYHVALVSSAGAGVPSNPRDLVRMSLGPVLSLLVGIGFAFFFDNLDHSLKNPEEVERYLGLPVLTSVKRRHPRELAF